MLALGCDHGGFELKQEIIGYLEEHKIPYKDFGCDSNKSVDYPVYARKVGKAIQSGECDKGILICGTGIGISIAANKMKGIRAALCTFLLYTSKSLRRRKTKTPNLPCRYPGC